MSSNVQIAANRQNSQSSTGPVTEKGKRQSSLNATRHGFTGQSLVLTPEEKSSYETHSISYLEQFQPATYEETDLIQQYADLRWTLHQISVQQCNLLSLINAITEKLIATGDVEALTAALAPHYKSLNTLSIYEQRRGRAAVAVLARFTELAEARRQQLAQAVEIYKLHKAKGEPFIPSDFGFVHSDAQIEQSFAVTTRLSEAKKLLAAKAA